MGSLTVDVHTRVIGRARCVRAETDGDQQPAYKKRSPPTAKAIGMNKPKTAPEPAPAPKTLTEQKADFTAEGSPPPGKVSTSLPAGSAAPAKTGPPRLRATTRPKRAPKSAGS
jgi:hypothetical protein